EPRLAALRRGIPLGQDRGSRDRRDLRQSRSRPRRRRKQEGHPLEQPAVSFEGPVPNRPAPCSPEKQEVSMSRYTITVTGQGRSDPDATIGYDPPLRTFFLQAFHHEVTDDPALWVGTYDQQFGTI